jgi:hypothetical protein
MGRACSMNGGRGMHIGYSGKARRAKITRKTKTYVGGRWDGVAWTGLI